MTGSVVFSRLRRTSSFRIALAFRFSGMRAVFDGGASKAIFDDSTWIVRAFLLWRREKLQLENFVAVDAGGGVAGVNDKWC